MNEWFILAVLKNSPKIKTLEGNNGLLVIPLGKSA